MSLSIVKPLVINSNNLTSNIQLPATGSGETLWVATTNYSVGDYVLSSINDPYYFTANIPGVYRALVGGVRSTNPENDPLGWEFFSVANRYLMFDNDASSPTRRYGSIIVTVALNGAVSRLGLYGLVADSVQVTFTDNSSNVILDAVYSLRRPPLLANYYNYFFDDIQNYSELLVSLPLYRTGNLTVSINGTNTVLCGNMVIGKEDVLTDDVEFGASMGISDYSGKKKDDVFGTDKFIRRGYSKHVDFSFLIKNASKDAVMQYLTDLRAVPSIYIMDGVTSVFGYYQDFKITIPYALESVCTLSLEGLTQ